MKRVGSVTIHFRVAFTVSPLPYRKVHWCKRNSPQSGSFKQAEFHQAHKLVVRALGNTSGQMFVLFNKQVTPQRKRVLS